MKIISPIARISEVDAVINAGADEIYCGLLTSEEEKKYTNMGCLNRRATCMANLQSLEELEKTVDTAHSKNIPVSFVINETYSSQRLPFALNQVKAAVEIGVDSVIISDFGLLNAFKTLNMRETKIFISSVNSVLNSESVRFYRDLGIARVILPRQLSSGEISAIVNKSAGIDFELLVLNKKCRYMEGFCGLQHGIVEATTPFFKTQKYSFTGKLMKLLPFILKTGLRKNFAENEFLCYYIYCDTRIKAYLLEKVNNGVSEKSFFENDYESIFDLNGCAACSLYDFDNTGIRFLKIIGRGNLTEKKIKDIRFIKGVIELIDKIDSRSDFESEVKKYYRQIYQKDCKEEYCYFNGNGT